MNGAKLRALREQRPEVAVVRKPPRLTLHLLERTTSIWTHCGMLIRDEVEVAQLRNLHLHRICRQCERWADRVIAGDAC